MFKAIIAALSLTFAVQAHAATTTPNVMDVMAQVQQQVINGGAHTQGLDWKVGDENDYTVDMGFIKGSLSMKVREVGADGIWMDQDVDLGMAGKQQASMLIDPNTGEVKKMIVGGKEQQIPKNNMEVVEVKEDKITVPAGSFDCVHARLKDKDTNKESNAWINPQLIPLSGMLKMIQPGQMGNVTLELKSFHKSN